LFVPLRVFLVDDHQLFREGLKSLLSIAGMEVIGEAGDGEEALQLVRELRPDMVLTDLAMPGMGGLETTRLLKAEHPDLPVVVLTASEEDADLFEAVKSGAQGYLLKSYPPTTVIELVEAAANGAPALTPSLASKLLAEFARQAGQPSASPRQQPTSTNRDLDEVEPLTAREREVLEQLERGATNKEIAQALFVSENTVKYHLTNILQKLHLQNRTQVVAYASRHRLTAHPEAE
jgi:DNA-binding NarL/FixJ family response regulator